MIILDRIGRFCSRLVFRNIAALIALGIMRVIFGPLGWWPDNEIYQIIMEMTKYMIPMLFAYQGGKMIGGDRAGVVASFVIIGIIAENQTGYVMILPAMLLGPLIGWLIAKLESVLENKTPLGFELLFYNAVSALAGILVLMVSISYIVPLFIAAMKFIVIKSQFLLNSGYLPLIAFIIEPAKVLFFNNVLNHGILEPLGLNHISQSGKSIFFLLESNPGPGFGLLLAYYFQTKSTERGNLKSSLIIEILGGIHEVYFPYALMKPFVILPLIAAGLSGDFIFSVLHAGLVATPSPGSVLELLALAPKGNQIAVLSGIIGSAAVSFFGTTYILSLYRRKENEPVMHEIANTDRSNRTSNPSAVIRKIVFACDAGMGSSAMGAAILKNKFKLAGLQVQVNYASVDEIPKDTDMVICQNRLSKRARSAYPDAEYITVEKFDDQEFYAQLVSRIRENHTLASPPDREWLQQIRMTEAHILLDCKAEDKWDAIKQAGKRLAELNLVKPSYIQEMLERENIASTYLTNGVAVPHGMSAESPQILNSGIVLLQFPGGVDFGMGNTAFLVIAIAGKGDHQLAILSKIAHVVDQQDEVLKLIAADSRQSIIGIIENNIKTQPEGEL